MYTCLCSHVGDACTDVWAFLCTLFSFLAYYCTHCLFEKLMLFLALIHALPTRGRIVSPIQNIGRSVHAWGEMLEERCTQFRRRTVCMHLSRSLHSCFGSPLCRLNLLCALLFCWWCRALLPHLEESTVWSILSWLCWAVALALGDQYLLSQVILFWLLFSFWSLCWNIYSFLFFSFLLWIGDYVCCQCTHQGGD
jgi:hypothetical protein